MTADPPVGAPPAVGQPAPAFAARDDHGTPLTNADFLGRPLLLVFFPWVFTNICKGELRALRDEFGHSPFGVQVAAVSTDAMYSQRVYADAEQLGFPLLSDHWPHGKIARAFGVFDEKNGAARRGTFVIDETGIIRWSVLHAIGEERDVQQYVKAIADLAL